MNKPIVKKPSLSSMISFCTPTEQTFEQKRFEAAKAAMQAIIIATTREGAIKEAYQDWARLSIMVGDELLKQLGEK